MRLHLFISLLLAATPSLAQNAPVATSASEWRVLTITKTDTVAKPGSVAVRSKASKAKAKATPTPPAADPVEAYDNTPKPAEKPLVAEKTGADVADRTTSAKSTGRKPSSRTFLETFTDNRNGWLTGKRNGFELEIAEDNSYYIRNTRPLESGKSGRGTARPGRSYIKLPDNLNLNKADTFTVSVEMVTPPGVSPDGGLLIGVKDTSNYCQFRLLDKAKVALYTRIDGVSQPSYMTGKPTLAKVPIDTKRNTLTIRRTGNELHFFINGREVEDSPHPYRPFKGNGVGFITYANAVKFQYLTVQVGK